VTSSGRWQKWLLADEKDKPFDQLGYPRQEWLVQTGARYVWTDPVVLAARAQLYENLRPVINDPHGYVIDKIVAPIDRYINCFNLFNLNNRLG
jgi:D-tagatose-1,6-bisphosphate aldolase subunit GatZ/KbaZ